MNINFKVIEFFTLLFKINNNKNLAEKTLKTVTVKLQLQVSGKLQ